MGQARKHRETIFRKSNGMCIYCGGNTPATTIDHMPPRCMFDRKDRPAGLEFPSCERCNRGAGLADLVCAVLGRVYPDANEPEALAELQGYLQAVKNNVPGLLEEMTVPRAQQKLRFRSLGLDADHGGLLRLGGPIALKHLEVFGARLGMAMHFEETGEIIPAEGGVFVRIYSNLDLAGSEVPQAVFDILPEPSTLEQGKKTVGSQFRYGVRATEGQRMTMSFASFRKSFATLAFSTTDIASFAGGQMPENAEPYRPGGLQVVLPQHYKSGASFRLA